MNNPLSYQASEYDCGPTALRNAISFLYERKDIPPEVIKYINLYCMDSYNQDGEPCKNGTSAVAMAYIASWLNQFGQMKKWPVSCQVLGKDDIYFGQNSRIIAALQQGGAAVVRVILDCAHYILLTGVEGEYVHVFDPYFWPHDFPDKRIITVLDQPQKLNRKIHWDVFNNEGKDFYNLGYREKRECILIFNKQTRLESDSAEYTI